MGSDYGFTKLWVGKGKTAAARKHILDLFDEKAKSHHLQPIARENEGAHFTLLLLDAGSGWLHFDWLGHYVSYYDSRQPQHSLHALLSHHYPTIAYFCSDDAKYGIRRWHKGEVIAKYTSSFFLNQQLFNDEEAAKAWFPVYSDWQDLLAPDITEEVFTQTLPRPYTKATAPPLGTPRKYVQFPDPFNKLFGWEPALGWACIAFNPEGNPGRGDYYQIEAGDYVRNSPDPDGFNEDYDDEDPPIDVIVHARHYAHPNPGTTYQPTWDEDTYYWS
ncbi:MAG: hypothetical protein AAF840_15080 [Bacteroidota bacterium]